MSDELAAPLPTPLVEDRVVANDIQIVRDLVVSGVLVQAAEAAVGTLE